MNKDELQAKIAQITGELTQYRKKIDEMEKKEAGSKTFLVFDTDND